MYPFLIYSAPFFIAAGFILIVAVFAFQRRRIRGAWYFISMCIAAAEWAVFEGMLYLGLNLKTDMLATYAQYLGAATFIPLALFFILKVFGYERWVNRTTVAAFLLATTAIVTLAWTDPLHHLVYTRFYIIDSGVLPLRGIERGPLWWVIISYQHLLGLTILGVLIHIVWTSTSVLRAQAGVILTAASMVWIANAIYVSGYSPVPNMDVSPLAFIFVALAMAWGFFRYHLLDVLPIAKAEIFRCLDDPIAVLDNHNRIIDLNPAAEALFNAPTAKAVGQNIVLMLKNISGNQDFQSLEDSKKDLCLRINSQEHFFDLRISDLFDKQGMDIGSILIFQQVTEHVRAVQARREQERLHGVMELAGAVCHNLSQPVMAILGYAELILIEVSQDHPLYVDVVRLADQAEKISEMTQKLMRITRYETKNHQGGRIIDIDKASI
jgi:PAS domain-containing protein